jgi:hypothetical protein
LALFFQFQQNPQIKVIHTILKKLNDLEAFFDKQKSWHFFSSSLLIAYEAKSNENENARIFMCDFAHTFPGKSVKDENYLFSLRCLISVLSELVQPDYEFDLEIKQEIIDKQKMM